MLLSKMVIIRITNTNFNYYLNKGYKVSQYLDKDKNLRVKKNTEISVLICDLPENCTVKVEVVCDYCGKKFYKKYKDYIKQRNKIKKDSCNDCKSKKMQDGYILNYGTVKQKELSELKGYQTGRKLKYDINSVIDILKEKNLILVKNLLKDIKIKSTDKIPFICNIHNPEEIQYRTLDQIIHSETCCKYRGFELRSGENNNRWKGGVTLESEKIRRSKDYQSWRTSVFERDQYTCKCCNDNSGGNLQAHHIENFSENKELIFDIDNGITLCEKCHNPSIIGSFHHTYGTHNNTQEQLEEYIASTKDMVVHL